MITQIDNKIFASEGFVLTNGSTYGKKVSLGINDTINNWHEITEEEYNKILESEEENEII